ncbi:response regulator transcription factor [Erysipelotrichaceae bacterium OttesenSCG-928-M19]|nr:response regulator transcription factor [Erysipelotrichaceae bacterium OttesenSCG-928-M19]
MNSILIIEDDLDYGEILKQFLIDSGFSVELVSDSISGVNLIKENQYDLIISDLYLDKLNGAQVIDLVKMYNAESKTMMISNSTDSNDELKSLRVGADDFIKKDSTFEVILARVNNVLEKNKNKTKIKVLKSDAEEIELDKVNRIVYKQGKMVALTGMEFDLIAYFLAHKNELLSREVLIEKVWKIPLDSASIDLRAVDAHIKNLRSKLKISSILSVRGIGYRWYE